MTIVNQSIINYINYECFQVAEEEVAVKEEGNPTSESAVEVPKAVEETPVAVDEKESASGVSVIISTDSITFLSYLIYIFVYLHFFFRLQI